MYTNSELCELVKDGKVDKQVYLDQGIFDLEMERVFAGTWVYVAHESQVKNNGDYITTEIGREPLILVRDEENTLRMFYNRCPHRGAKIEVEQSGSLKRFVCNFHCYTFNTNGSINSIPLEDSYENADFGADRNDFDLVPVACLESYRGFIFAKLSPNGLSLLEWLGDVVTTLDNFVNRSPENEVEVVGPPLRWMNECNWKLIVENVLDGAHVVGVHPSIGKAGSRLADQRKRQSKPVPDIAQMTKAFYASAKEVRNMGVTVLGNGHGYSGGKVALHSSYTEVPGYRESLQNAYGEDGAKNILGQQRHNTNVYPNMNLKTMIQKIHIIKPVAPNRTIVESWVFRLKGAPEELLKRTMLYSQLLDSPAALVSTDDAEAMIRTQRGLESSSTQWVSLHRGQHRPSKYDGETIHCEGDSEVPIVKQYETWLSLMTQDAFS